MELEEAISQLRRFKRNVRLVVQRTSSPSAGEDFFVQKLDAERTTNGVEITDLRVKFSIERDLSKHPNSCDIEVYNLAQTTRAAVETKPLLVELAAGHDGVSRLLSTGDVLFAMSKQEGPEWVTMLQLGDGARATARARAKPRSYGKNTTVKQVLRDIAKSMGQGLPKNIEASADLDAQFANSISLSGYARDEMTKILAPYGYNWSIQNGRLQILRDETARTDMLEISERTGMIGTPSFGDPPKSGKPPHVTVKMLLYPELVPGGRIQLTSRAKSGTFKLVKVKHTGDTHGDEWFTEVEIQPLASRPK